jgi:PAS domain S-box-containing protein
MAVLGLVVFATAVVSIVMTRGTGGVSAIWPPDAIVLAAVLLLSRRLAPLLIAVGFLGSFLANQVVGMPVSLAVGMPLCNALGIAVAAFLYRRRAGVDPEGRFLGFSGARDLFAFAAICGGIGPMASASLAGLLISFVTGAAPLAVWTEWLLSDALGILVITPVLLSTGRGGARQVVAERDLGEVALLFGASLVITLLAFTQDRFPLLFLLFPAVILPAFRLGFPGTGLVCMMVSAIAIAATLLGSGSLTMLGRADIREQVVLLQLFLLLLNLTALPVASAMDARRLAERRLLQLSNLQQAILNGADYAIIATRPDGIITLFNAGAARMLGYRAAEVIGKTTPSLFHLRSEMEDRAAALSAELGRLVTPDADVFVARSHVGPDEHDWTYVRKDGTRLPIRLSVTALRDEVGSISGYLGIAKDVTEERKSEERLLASRRDLQSVIDNIPAMIAYWDKDL